MIKLSQGEAFEIEFVITANDYDGAIITPEIVTEVEVTLENITKLYSKGEVYYDGMWVFPLTQEETFKLSGVRPLKVRAKFTDEQVGKAELGPVVVHKEKSRRVL